MTPGRTSADSSARSAARRAPRPEERRRDADRTRGELIEAAFGEFASHGYAGARVLDIAARAGVDKQLITYYFDGKEGLYQEVLRTALSRDAEITDDDLPLADNIARWVRHVLADPRLTRLLLWAGLSEDPESPATVPADVFSLAGMVERQERGEVPSDLDPAAIVLVIIGCVSAAVSMPHVIRALFGVDPASPEFEERYATQLREIIGRMVDGGRGKSDSHTS
jgi:AcrR family transcriptional regulator